MPPYLFKKLVLATNLEKGYTLVNTKKRPFFQWTIGNIKIQLYIRLYYNTVLISGQLDIL
jgi:hypothetical protein